MKKIHYAIKNESLSTKNTLVESILKGNHSLSILKNKNGLLFSNTVLQKFIEKEAKYDTQILTLKENRSIRTFSSGEQKKALLNYLIEQKPAFLILDSPFESLDIKAVSKLEQTLINLSSEILLIQIYNRKDELLPIITTILNIENDAIVSSIAIEKYNFKEAEIAFKGDVPKPITFYKNIPEQLVLLQNVNVDYNGDSVLNAINWQINKNEFWQLIGPNGSGKTTILSMIYGNNVKAFRQEVYLFGKKKGTGESVWEIKEKIGFFSPAILELFTRKITVIQMILSGFFDSIGLYETPTYLQISLAEKWIKLLDLESKKNTSFENISTTTQRLILIARAMIKHPPLLILDEPLVHLDNQGTAIVIALINKIVSESETTVLFVSHRNVAGLAPNLIYELTPSKNGSSGNVKI
ncbi:ATP-binding cassette domain-containing protein [Polaribacter sp. PL03]|uniref:ATP-binding cassette domain-containing protein n=1 Tax=Polaribacter sp. PL03 TaxID=3088353 RepID=UPI0029D14260|nr:ATP-binding cassette domain-containing protein [Polaribacter sp. PL03]MDX6746117.1 ATP-binding cassette domain-containing protein [Polaribacter sp. PL03]